MNFEIKKYEIEIKLLTGLHIGGADTAMKIGGVDSEVVKHPVTKNPYIPGSSIKGKIRTLLEYAAGIRNGKGEPFSIKDYDGTNENVKIILQLFGAGAGDSGDKMKENWITRLSFSDAVIDINDDNKKDALTESKAENSIDRIKGTAKSPRFIERVVSGNKFNGSISMRLFEGDDEDLFCKKTAEGLWLLEQDALGGSGSRGYGRVKITVLSDGKLKEKKEELEKNK